MEMGGMYTSLDIVIATRRGEDHVIRTPGTPEALGVSVQDNGRTHPLATKKPA